VRPVTVWEWWVFGPTPQPVSFTVSNLNPDTIAVRAALEASVADMIQRRARPSTAENGVTVPAQTIYAAWISEAISAAPGVISFDLIAEDMVPIDNGHIAVPGVITYST
jgi:hypothetical protein